MKIPFTKAHGARNDFLLTWRQDAPATSHADLARALCDRHTGIGADGWLLVDPPASPEDAAQADGTIQLYNSDGSTAEISGNGTRCAAAFLIRHGYATNDAKDLVRIRTGAGIKTLRLLNHAGLLFTFEMNMGRAEITALHFDLPLSTGPRDVTILWVGNPQCTMPVENFDFDWRALSAEIEAHPHFPNRTNVSFLKPVDQHTIEVRFYERGAGETMSSGTGSTGAAATAVARGMAKSPVRVLTPAGPIDLRLEDDIYLTGPAEIVAEGEFFA
ncbi:MAG TPA: diaminopimelate epimerase [Candidatus Acidoferrales bacterium]|jgi:diaminopimelate epimerase|nr:diaminopimelate epimerase [Candidatus Acidoferrales bacterium]